jgi:hypothetical protein
MHIYLNSFTNQGITLFKESVLPALTAQQKKILIAASMAFAFLAGFYMAKRGYFQSKLQNGYGKIIDQYGVIQEGEFKRGKLNGMGRITFPGGLISEGEFQGGKLNGMGKSTFKKNGQIDTVEKGEFRDNVLHGMGEITEFGRVLKGEFKGGKLHGSGKIIYPDGSVEEGQFNNGQNHLFRWIDPKEQAHSV